MDLFKQEIPLWQVILLVGTVIMGQRFLQSSKKVSKPSKPSPQPQKVETKRTEAPLQDALSKAEDDDFEDDGYEDPYDADYLFFDGKYDIRNDYTVRDAPFKMLLIVNKELKMGNGKIAAQCGHATMGNYKLSRKYCPSALNAWERTGVAKVCVKVDKQEEMYDIFQIAKAVGIVAYIVEDAGRTQIAAGSHTVLSLGPAPAAMIDPICKHLKLMN